MVNVVATLAFPGALDLQKVARELGAEYDGRKYNGRVAYLRTPGMRGTVSIFSSGQLIAVGARSEREACHNLRQVAVRLSRATGRRRHGRTKPQVRNVVATVDLVRRLDIARLSLRLPHAIYEPEQFPAIIWHPRTWPRVSVLVFSSGKLVIAGAPSVPAVQKIAELLAMQLHQQGL